MTAQNLGAAIVLAITLNHVNRFLGRLAVNRVTFEQVRIVKNRRDYSVKVRASRYGDVWRA